MTEAAIARHVTLGKADDGRFASAMRMVLIAGRLSQLLENRRECSERGRSCENATQCSE
jgi:hypothetical protein